MLEIGSNCLLLVSHTVQHKTNELALKCLQMDVFDAAERYGSEDVPLVALVGKDYGSGSSRDWAAKGPYLLVLTQNKECGDHCFMTLFAGHQSCDSRVI